jgi:hypothetical protein
MDENEAHRKLSKTRPMGANIDRDLLDEAIKVNFVYKVQDMVFRPHSVTRAISVKPMRLVQKANESLLKEHVQRVCHVRLNTRVNAKMENTRPPTPTSPAGLWHAQPRRERFRTFSQAWTS